MGLALLLREPLPAFSCPECPSHPASLFFRYPSRLARTYGVAATQIKLMLPRNKSSPFGQVARPPGSGLVRLPRCTGKPVSPGGHAQRNWLRLAVRANRKCRRHRLPWLRFIRISVCSQQTCAARISIQRSTSTCHTLEEGVDSR